MLVSSASEFVTPRGCGSVAERLNAASLLMWVAFAFAERYRKKGRGCGEHGLGWWRVQRVVCELSL